MSNKEFFRLSVISALLLGVWLSFIALYGAVDALNTPEREWGRGAVNCSDVNVAWQDRRDGDWDIYINRSADGATSWGNGYEISDGPVGTDQTWPDLGECEGCSGSWNETIYAVWEDDREGDSKIHFSYAWPSTITAGLAWPKSIAVAPSLPITKQHWPAVRALHSGLVGVVWEEYSGTDWSIGYNYSDPPYNNWSITPIPKYVYGMNGENHRYPDLDTDGEEFHAVWVSETKKIIYERSVDNGENWSASFVEVSSGTSTTVTWPVVAVITSTGHYTAHIAWQQHDGSDWDIYYQQVANGSLNGSSVSVVKPLANNSNQIHPTIAASGTLVYIAWQDDRDGVTDHNIYAARSTDGGSSFSAANIKVNSVGAESNQGDPALGIDDDGKVHCVFDDAFGGEGIKIASVMDATAAHTEWHNAIWDRQVKLAQWEASNIPTLSEWGMVGFAALLGLYALWGIRKQRGQV